MKGFLRRLKRQITWCTSRWQLTRRDGGIWDFCKTYKCNHQKHSALSESYVDLLKRSPLDKLMRSFIASCDRRCLSKLKIWHLRLPIHDFKLHCIHYISLDDLLLIFIQSKHSSYDGLYCATFYVFQQEVFASLFSRYRTCFRNRNRVSGLWLIRRYKFRFFQVSRSCLLLLIFVAITWKELLKFHFGVWQFFISQLKPIVSFE